MLFTINANVFVFEFDFERERARRLSIELPILAMQCYVDVQQSSFRRQKYKLGCYT